MAESFANTDGREFLEKLALTIHENAAYLSEIDGKIGDGDHGINMDKGFQLALERLEDGVTVSDALMTLGRTLLMEIGGSMGPLYGQFFKALARASRGEEQITSAVLLHMLEAGYEAIRELGNAKPGDKTLVDTLDPAVAALRKAVDNGTPLHEALDELISAAEQGWKATEAMISRVGRSSRLGERSRGVLDAGATSCMLLLRSMADQARERAAGDQ